MNLVNTENSIETENLILEPIVVDHAEKLFDLLQAVDLYKFIPHDPPKDIAYLKAKFSKWSKRQSPDKEEIWINYAIYMPFEKGYVGTVQATIQSKETVYIAYEVFPKYWKRGIAKEACIALINFLFENYQIDTVTAHLDTRNEASMRLLQSLDFSEEKIIKDADFFKGKTSNEFVYTLSKEQWYKL